MKRLLVLALLATACTVPAANAAAAKGPTQAQFNALKTTVAKQAKDISSLKVAVGFAVIYGECLTAATADAFQGTWGVIDQIAQATQAGKTYFGTQTPIAEPSVVNCSLLQLTRSHSVPPTISIFSSLATLLS